MVFILLTDPSRMFNILIRETFQPQDMVENFIDNSFCVPYDLLVREVCCRDLFYRGSAFSCGPLHLREVTPKC